MIPRELLATDAPPSAEARRRAWWVRWLEHTGAAPDLITDRQQARRGLVFPVERLGERRALRLRTTGEPRQ